MSSKIFKELAKDVEAALIDLKSQSSHYKSDSSYAMSELALVEAVEALSVLADHARQIEEDLEEWEGGRTLHKPELTDYASKDDVIPESKL